MRPDVSIDYYGLLGVQPNASEDEIKRAFRKQALLHHPDRNPGKEEEAKSKFQEMQAAYDTLSTPQKRQRYDQERLKQGMLWQKRSTTTSEPPKAQQNFFRANQQQARPSHNTARPSRYADYASTSRDSSPFPSDVNAKFQAFKAFEHMKGSRQPSSPPKNSPPKTRPAPTAQKTRSRSDWDESPYPESPRMPRSQSTRVPHRDGFNPYSEGGDEPSPRNASAYYNVSRGGKSQASYPRTAANMFAQANQNGVPPSPKINIDLNGDEYYASDRQSTPYASMSGEKTYFSSAGFGKPAGTATNLQDLGSGRARGSPNLGSGRFRSASPGARSPRPDPDDETSSDDDDESFGDRMKQSQQAYYTRRGSADPRQAPKVSVQDESDESPAFAMPKRQQTWDSEKHTSNGPARTHYFPPSSSSRGAEDAGANDTTPRQARPNLERDSTVPRPASGSMPSGTGFGVGTTPTNTNAGNGKKPSLYEHLFPSAQDTTKARSEESVHRSSQCATRKTSRNWPYWAIPSSVLVSSPKDAGYVKQTEQDSNSPDDGIQDDANINVLHSSFSIPSSSSGSASPLKNSSAENVNTQFSPTKWNGQFFGAPDHLNPQQTPAARNNQRSKGSPPKRPTARKLQTSPPSTSHGQPGGVAAAQAVNNSSSSEFGDWNKKFQDNTWANPLHPTPASKRPIATPRSRNPKRPTQATQSHGAGDSASPFVIPDDTGDEGDDEKQSTSNLVPDPNLSRSTSTSAMDIDDAPPATRASSGTANGRMPSHMNVTSPNSDLASFPKPPPPSTAFNMQPLSATFPMAGSSSAGLTDLKADLGSTLPFESGAADNTNTPQAQKLDLPRLPKQPLPPGRVVDASFHVYMTQVTAYIHEFHNWNGRMLEHLRSRQATMEQLTSQKSAANLTNGVGGPIFGFNGSSDLFSWSWMGARGDDDYLRYMAWMEEDARVRMAYNLGWDRHKEALENLGKVRKLMKSRSESVT